MISQVRGVLVEKSPAGLVVEVGGIGLSVLIPLSTFDHVPDEGQEVFLLTYLHVREEILALYGFATRPERDLFRALIGVSGVGPKLALACLSGARTEDLRNWIREEQVGPLTRIPGLGKKTAQRVVLELKERLGGEEPIVVGGTQASGGALNEAVLALEALGMRDAREKVTEILRGGKKEELQAEEIVRRALARWAR